MCWTPGCGRRPGRAGCSTCTTRCVNCGTAWAADCWSPAAGPRSRIPALVKGIGATSVHVSGDFSPFGLRRDKAVREALGDVPLEESGSPYLVSPGRVTKGDGTPYKVFTPFYAAWREHGWRAPAKTGPTSATWIDPADVGGGVDIPERRRRTRTARRRGRGAQGVEDVRRVGL